MAVGKGDVGIKLLQSGHSKEADFYDISSLQNITNWYHFRRLIAMNVTGRPRLCSATYQVRSWFQTQQGFVLLEYMEISQAK